MILQELRARVIGTVVWSVAFVSMIVLGMTEFDAFESDTSESLGQLMDSFPRIIRVIYGMEGVDVTTIEGYFSLIILYVLIMVAFHGALLGASLINRELKSGASEFIFSTPMPRLGVVVRKEVAALIIIVFIQAMIALSAVYVLAGTEGEGLLSHTMVASVVTHVVFFYLGYAAALFFVDRSRSQAVAISVPVLGYLLVVLSQLLDVPRLSNITPIGFFDADYFLTPLRDALPYSIGAVALFGLMSAGAAMVFRRRDLGG